MLIKLLSDQDKNYFFEMAELLSLSDKPLLWDGRAKDEITSQTNIGNVSLQKGAPETSVLSDWRLIKDQGGLDSTGLNNESKIEKKLIEKIKSIPLQSIEDPATRIQAALEIFRDIVKGSHFIQPSAAKLMLFELMLLALSSGTISNIEWQLLNEFKVTQKIEDFIFQDILERAETTHRETQKTISLILE